MKQQIFSLQVMRPAFATVLVKASSEEEARNIAVSRAHETVGIEDYCFGDFTVLQPATVPFSYAERNQPPFLTVPQ